jgi:ribosomal protein S21
MKPFNFQVIEKPGESQERLIKRFLNKTSRSNIVQACLDKMCYVSNSQKNRKKKNNKTYVKRKIQQEYENSLKSSFSEK